MSAVYVAITTTLSIFSGIGGADTPHQTLSACLAEVRSAEGLFTRATGFCSKRVDDRVVCVVERDGSGIMTCGAEP